MTPSSGSLVAKESPVHIATRVIRREDGLQSERLQPDLQGSTLEVSGRQGRQLLSVQGSKPLAAARATEQT